GPTSPTHDPYVPAVHVAVPAWHTPVPSVPLPYAVNSGWHDCVSVFADVTPGLLSTYPSQSSSRLLHVSAAFNAWFPCCDAGTPVGVHACDTPPTQFWIGVAHTPNPHVVDPSPSSTSPLQSSSTPLHVSVAGSTSCVVTPHCPADAPPCP